MDVCKFQRSLQIQNKTSINYTMWLCISFIFKQKGLKISSSIQKIFQTFYHSMNLKIKINKKLNIRVLMQKSKHLNFLPDIKGTILTRWHFIVCLYRGDKWPKHISPGSCCIFRATLISVPGSLEEGQPGSPAPH